MDIRSILQRHSIRPSKGLGQNFLGDERILERIVETAEVGPADTVLEIGPGLGLLTRRLAERAGRVVAVELDRKMLAVLAETVGDRANVHVVQADILEIDPPTTLATLLKLPEAPPYAVVANLPYYITSAVLRHLLSAPQRPARLTLMVQLEVAQRIVAPAGELSLLALSVQVFGTPRIAFRVPAGAFIPPPKVDSAVLRIDVAPEPRIPEPLLGRFFALAQAGFGQKRKQLRNSLSSNLGMPAEQVGAALAAAGIDASRRAQTITIEEWERLCRAIGPLPEEHVSPASA